ncbi:hypothetical protein ScPMuIL_006010 [Solemya velum]
MVALGVKELLFLCYTSDTITAFLVKHSEALWQKLLAEMIRLYGSQSPVKPTKISPVVSELRADINMFLKQNVEFLGEFPSIVATACTHHPAGNTNEPVHIHSPRDPRRKRDLPLGSLRRVMTRSASVVEDSDRLTKPLSAEILVFMLSDLDRLPTLEQPRAVPIAYGLKGYSMKTEVMRKMISHVRRACVDAGLAVPVIAYDGQWNRVSIRDGEGRPQTLLQLQKDVYEETKRKSKAEHIALICSSQRVEVHNTSDITEVVNWHWEGDLHNISTNSALHNVHSRLVITGHTSSTPITLPKQALSMIVNQAQSPVLQQTEGGCTAVDIEKEITSIDNTEGVVDVASHLASDWVEKPTDAVDQVDLDHESFMVITVDVDCEQPCVPGPDVEAMEQDGEEPPRTFMGSQEEPSTNLEPQEEPSVLEDTVIYELLCALQNCRNTPKRKKRWLQCSDIQLNEVLKDAANIEVFTCQELKALISRLSALKGVETRTRSNDSKLSLTNSFCELVGLTRLPLRSKPKSPKSLRLLCKAVISTRYSKAVLNVIIATHVFPHRYQEWCDRALIPNNIKLEGCEGPSYWYSQPVAEDGQVVFHFLDNEHLLTNMRTKCCTTGMKAAGIDRQAWVKVAKENRQNKTGLTLAHVEDLIDKQSCAYALTTFSEKVEAEMRKNGDVNEAEFTHTFRQWYESEDLAGISQDERIRRRLRMREWLLKDVEFDTFPPHGSHVKDIPVVLFEGLLTSIDRHIQLFPFVANSAYNVRTIGTLDIENFFSEFTEFDPKGTGVLKPGDVKEALANACKIFHARMDKTRCFAMKTSKARPYPVKDIDVVVEEMGHTLVESFGITDISAIRSLTSIQPRDHAFDRLSRQRRNPRRKSGDILGPGHAARGSDRYDNTTGQTNPKSFRTKDLVSTCS